MRVAVLAAAALAASCGGPAVNAYTFALTETPIAASDCVPSLREQRRAQVEVTLGLDPSWVEDGQRRTLVVTGDVLDVYWTETLTNGQGEPVAVEFWREVRLADDRASVRGFAFYTAPGCDRYSDAQGAGSGKLYSIGWRR